MTDEKTQYMSEEKLEELESELEELKKEKIPALAKKIDEAKQMGDLSENAEYHSAREEMSWARSREQELNQIIQNSQVIAINKNKVNIVNIGSTIVVEANRIKKEFTIVGPQEAEPLVGKISNESPLGSAFLGKKKGDRVQVKVPAGMQEYEIVEIK